jgi:ATP-binding cassette, subfamily B, bacterial
MSYLQEEEFQDQKVDLKMWGRLMAFARPYRKYIIGIISCMVFAGCADVAFSFITSMVIDNHISKGVWDGIGWYMLVSGTLLVAQCVVVFSFIRMAGITESGITHDIRRDGFKKLQELSFSYYDKTPVGYMMARMTSDAGRLGETIAWTLVDQCWGFTFMIAALVGMFVMKWQLALLVLASVPFIALVSIYFQRRILLAQREVRKTNSRITGAFNEGITGARTTKTLVREDLNFKEFSTLTGTMRNASVRTAVMSAIFTPLVMTIGAVSTGLVVWFGGWDVNVAGLTIGQLSFFLSLTAWFFEPIRAATWIFAELQGSQAAVERVLTLMATEPEIKDSAEVEAVFGDAFNPRRENWPEIHGQVEFKNVSFTYKAGQKVLDNFNLKVHAGEKIALVGETGSGKSTIVNLICRFYEPTEGSILLDGVDYRERSQLWLHSNLGYVLQAPHLFSGTIRDNIRYGMLEATDEQVEEAARVVDAHDFIMRLDKGYDTEVGEGGGRLSTGEKQLISFARAIIAKPALFVLDEATSSIDTETERKIQYAIDKLLHGRTSFIIAHRLSTIRTADRIMVIKQGKVEEEGTHRELMAHRGDYYNLYTNQFKEEAENRLLGIANKEEEEETA